MIPFTAVERRARGKSFEAHKNQNSTHFQKMLFHVWQREIESEVSENFYFTLDIHKKARFYRGFGKRISAQNSGMGKKK